MRDSSNPSALLVNKSLNIEDDMLIGKLMENLYGIEDQPESNDLMEQLLTGITSKLSSGVSTSKRTIAANDVRRLNNVFDDELIRRVVGRQCSNFITEEEPGYGDAMVNERERQIGSTGEERNKEFKRPQSLAVKSKQRLAKGSIVGSARRVIKPASVDHRQVLREVLPKENNMILDILADHSKMLSAVNKRVKEMENDQESKSYASSRIDLQSKEYASSKYEIESRGYESSRNDLEPGEYARSQYELESRGCPSPRYGRGPKIYADLNSNIESSRYGKQKDFVESRVDTNSKSDYKCREHSGSKYGLEARDYAGSTSDVRTGRNINLKNNVRPTRYANSTIQNESSSTVTSTHHRMRKAATLMSSRAGTLSNCRQASNLRAWHSNDTAVTKKRGTAMSRVFAAKNNITGNNRRQLENVKLYEKSVSNILHRHRNGKFNGLGQHDPSSVPAACSMRETLRDNGSRTVKSMKVTITPNSRRQINLAVKQCEPEIPVTIGYQGKGDKAIGTSGKEKSFDVIESMTDCLETSRNNQPASSSRFKRNGPLRRSFTKKNYRNMKQRDKSEPKIVSEIPTTEQSSHDKVKGWIEKNHIESHDSGEQELDVSERAHENNGMTSKEDVATSGDAILISSSAEKSMTPTDKLPTRMAQAGYKVKRSLGFNYDKDGQEKFEEGCETEGSYLLISCFFFVDCHILCFCQWQLNSPR